MKKAVFIDKDGTLIKNVPYNINAQLVRLEPHAGKALHLLKQNNYFLIVISNQSGIAQNYFGENDLEQINAEIQKQLLSYNVQLDGFYYCPHLPGGIITKYAIDCDCRKPKPGLLLKAAKDFDIDLNQSWMIGDILNDVEAGKEAGCKTILIDNGNETEWLLNEHRTPHFKAKDLHETADIITKGENKNAKRSSKFLAKL